MHKTHMSSGDFKHRDVKEAGTRAGAFVLILHSLAGDPGQLGLLKVPQFPFLTK